MAKFFHKICDLDVEPLRKQLEHNPHLWSENPFRTGYTDSPFAKTSDIWVRYRALEELKEPKDYLQPHKPVFYPAWKTLSELFSYVRVLEELVGAVELGGILITRKPPGAKIPLHSDAGSWHAEHMDAKVWLTIDGPSEGCAHIGGGEEIVMKPGEGWSFNNLLPHAVGNRSNRDQVTLIVSMRSASGNFLGMKE